jgi:hypothetical protein
VNNRHSDFSELIASSYRFAYDKIMMTERRILQILLTALGLAAIAISLMIYLLGQAAVNLVAAGFDALTGQAAPEITISPTMDSEMRFYAVFWFTYGAVLIWVARGLSQRIQFVPLLAALFFAGGVGRVLSQLMVGPPHPAFTVLMAIELVLPVVFVGLYLRLKK